MTTYTLNTENARHFAKGLGLGRIAQSVIETYIGVAYDDFGNREVIAIRKIDADLFEVTERPAR